MILNSYFSDLFSTSHPTNIRRHYETVKRRMSDKHRNWCAKIYTKQEVKETLDQMHPLKSPGPYGLPTLFYKNYWNLIGSDVKKMVLKVMNNNYDPSEMNKTFTTLIPKFKNPRTRKEFLPISLCNVILKLVTKVIANRLKVILPEVIDHELSDFVKGRMITNNALIALECFQWMNKKTKGRKGVMVLKLDMSEAYDKIEWGFVTMTLEAMGFPEEIVKLIKRCIESVSYKILINGKEFFPERGFVKEIPSPLTCLLFVQMSCQVCPGRLREIQVSMRSR